MSRQCLEPLLQYGQQAMEDNKQQRCTYALEQVVLAVIVTTGLVSILVTREHTADYNSGLAHGIFYAMTTLPEFEKIICTAQWSASVYCCCCSVMDNWKNLNGSTSSIGPSACRYLCKSCKSHQSRWKRFIR